MSIKGQSLHSLDQITSQFTCIFSIMLPSLFLAMEMEIVTFVNLFYGCQSISINQNEIATHSRDRDQ